MLFFIHDQEPEKENFLKKEKFMALIKNQFSFNEGREYIIRHWHCFRLKETPNYKNKFEFEVEGYVRQDKVNEKETDCVMLTINMKYTLE